MNRQQTQEKMFNKLARRLNGKNVTWVPGGDADPSVVATIVETAVDRESRNDVILISDERACDFESFRLKLGEKLEKVGGGNYPSNSKNAVFTIEVVRDYGKVQDLNKDGEFADYNLSEEQGRIIELDVSYVSAGVKRGHRRVILAAVESFEFAARFFVPNAVRVHTVVALIQNYHIFNGIILAGTWPITVASALGAKWAIVDHQTRVDFMKAGKGVFVRNNEVGSDAPIAAYPHMRAIMERRCRLSEVKELLHDGDGNTAFLYEICEDRMYAFALG